MIESTIKFLSATAIPGWENEFVNGLARSYVTLFLFTRDFNCTQVHNGTHDFSLRLVRARRSLPVRGGGRRSDEILNVDLLNGRNNARPKVLRECNSRNYWPSSILLDSATHLPLTTPILSWPTSSSIRALRLYYLYSLHRNIRSTYFAHHSHTGKLHGVKQYEGCNRLV